MSDIDETLESVLYGDVEEKIEQKTDGNNSDYSSDSEGDRNKSSSSKRDSEASEEIPNKKAKLDDLAKNQTKQTIYSSRHRSPKRESSNKDDDYKEEIFSSRDKKTKDEKSSISSEIHYKWDNMQVEAKQKVEPTIVQVLSSRPSRDPPKIEAPKVENPPESSSEQAPQQPRYRVYARKYSEKRNEDDIEFARRNDPIHSFDRKERVSIKTESPVRNYKTLPEVVDNRKIPGGGLIPGMQTDVSQVLKKIQIDPQSLNQSEPEKKREVESKNTYLSMNSFNPAPPIPIVNASNRKESADNSTKRRDFKQYISSVIVKRLSYYLQKKEIESKEYFKHLARSMTKKLMKKEEGKYNITPNTKRKVVRYIDKYFAKKNTVYSSRDSSEGKRKS